MNKDEAIKYLQQIYPNGGHCWLDEQRIEAIGMAVKALQEEPVSEDFENALAEEWKGYNDRGAAKVDALEDNTQELAFAKGFYRGWHYKKEKPVSEDLEEASKEWLRQQLDKSYANYGEAKMMELTHFDGYAMLDAIEFGAKWKEEQFEKNRLAACDKQTEEEAEREQDFVMGIIENEHRKPTFDDAIKYGMRLQRENMMKDAVDAVVHIEAGNYPYIPQLELYDYDKDIPLAKEGDKYKVVLIKEE